MMKGLINNKSGIYNSCEIAWLFFLFLLLVTACGEAGHEENNTESSNSAGFIRMTDSINSIIQKADLSQNIYENDVRYDYFISQFQASNQSSPELLFRAAIEALNMGNTERAIELIKQLQAMAPILKEINRETLQFHQFLAICYMRLGEQNNCIHNHTDQSCIVPIAEKGIHINKTGSQNAIEKYLEILAVFPEDYESRWLLNLAYMTLDQYPDKVPQEYFIAVPEKSPDSRLENVATRSGLDHFGLSGGVIIDDFNNDDLLDIVMSSWGFEGTVKYYVNNGPDGFSDNTAQSRLELAKGGLNLKQADYNNDGHLDFLILRGAWKPQSSWGIPSNSLIRNNGDGTFSDVTFEAGMYSRRPTQSAEWFDYNNDGWLDLFVANETTSSSNTQFPCELFRNNGDGTFTDVAADLNVDFVGYFKGVVAGDINNDGWQDLYISNLSGDNLLLLNMQNDGKGVSFKDISAEAGVQLPYSSFPAWFFDYDNDGWLDIFAAAYGPLAYSDQAGQFARELLGDTLQLQASRLYKNNGDLTFTASQTDYFENKALSTMGCNFGDFNADGYPDFYLGTGAPDYRAIVPNRLFTNLEGKQFEEQTFELGVGHIQKGHGVSFADLNNDGSLDIYAVMGGAFKGDKFPNAFFRNQHNEHNWIKLTLVGKNVNRSALGARIRVIGSVFGSEADTIYSYVGSGASFGANPFMVYLGLGNMDSIQSVGINWPGDKNQYEELGPLELNAAFRVVEEENPVKLSSQAFDFKQIEASTHQHMHK